MDFLPVFLDLRDRSCVVVGGGDVAARKVALLLRTGAQVRVIAPAFCAELAARVAAGAIEGLPRTFAEADLDGARFVIAATDDAATERRAVPVNVVDQPALCSAIMPSIIDRSPVVIAVGTGGSAPVLARLLRARLETLVPPAYGELASLLGSLRARVRAALPDQRTRRRFWEAIIDGPAAELLFAGRRAEAVARIEQALDEGERIPRGGEVYLVGTGPGDPDLLTFRALRLLQLADVVVYDRLVGDDIVDLARRDAERVFVGKATRSHAVEQEDINALLVRLAREGRRVARLKGGDPFVFGRGGEEIEALAAAAVPFQVVPGITAALGCAAYAGIPLTHRDIAHSCLFVTAHQRHGQLMLDWAQLVRPRQTVVVYMGVAALPALCAGLVAHGAASDLPAAVVERGTTAAQRVLVATLADLPQVAAAAAVAAPSLVIVGGVVALAERLGWREAAPRATAGGLRDDPGGL